MKKLFLTLILAFSMLPAWCQQRATTFQKASQYGISVKLLDSLYTPALSGDADSMKTVFYGKYTEFVREYRRLILDLNEHLTKNHFIWGKTTRCFNRIYFNEHGTIDYFLYNFRPGEITPEKEQQFEKLLTAFIEAYKFPLPAPSKFAQCSPVTYTDYQ